MRTIAVIPARLGSTRLPNKPLRPIAGKPMVIRVSEAAKASKRVDRVLVATDAEEVMRVCREHGIEAVMTSAAHRSGTERVHEIAQKLDADVYLNIQGDEPLTRPEHIDALLALMARPEVEVGTLMTRCGASDVANPNAVKVVTDVTGRALYFSRATIPYDRDRTILHERDRSGTVRYFKHLGFYGYRKPQLARFVALPESALEAAERLEQLRFLENGIPIHVAETPFDTVGVDTEEDVRRVEEMFGLR
jgi:3-deoxy-manno-octulosonate cytidylyltransferase (CMP-KDO synthetase)